MTDTEQMPWTDVVDEPVRILPFAHDGHFRLERRDASYVEWSERRNTSPDGQPRNGWCDYHCNSRRLDKYTCVEGSAEEFKYMATCFLCGEKSYMSERCAYEVSGNYVLFWSPRNSCLKAPVPYWRVRSTMIEFLKQIADNSHEEDMKRMKE